MGSDQNEGVIRHCGKSTTIGWAMFGSLRATYRSVSTRSLMNYCSPSCEKPSKTNGFSASSVACLKQDISKIGGGIKPTVVHLRGPLSARSLPICTWTSWTNLSKTCSSQSTQKERRGKPTKSMKNSCIAPLTSPEKGEKRKHAA